MTNHEKILKDLSISQSTADSIAGRMELPTIAVELLLGQLIAKKEVESFSLGTTNLLVYRLTAGIPTSTTMTILVRQTFDSFKARIITSTGKITFTASCTSGELAAAKAVVKKAYGAQKSETVFEIKDPAELERRGINKYMANPQRKQIFHVFGFKH